MDNEKLKKKIVETLKAHIYIDNYGLVHRLDYAEIADALIAAGIGDVKELKEELKVQEAVANQYRIFFEEQKYWKEVAEMALENEIKNRINITGDVEDLVYTYYGRAIYQAEKELSEERKDEN